MTLKAAQMPQNPTSREVTPERGDGDKDKKPQHTSSILSFYWRKNWVIGKTFPQAHQFFSEYVRMSKGVDENSLWNTVLQRLSHKMKNRISHVFFSCNYNMCLIKMIQINSKSGKAIRKGNF